MADVFVYPTVAPAVPLEVPPDEQNHVVAVAQRFAALARDLSASESLQTTVAHAVTDAVAMIEGCDHASVSLKDHGRVITAEATDPWVREMDRAQYDLEDGPCLRAIQSRSQFLVTDLTASPWPALAARAARLELTAVLSCSLSTVDEIFGSLNLYSRRGFSDADQALAPVYAQHAALAIGSTRREAQLLEALATRQTIGQAVGILIERHHLSPEQAFKLLSRASQDRNTKVRDLASWLVETGVVPDSPATSTGRRRRRPARRSPAAQEDGYADIADAAPAANGAASRAATPLLKINPLDNGRAGLRLTGEIDVSTHAQLATALTRLRNSSGPEVHLELGELTFIDVAGARMLLEAAEQVHHANGARMLLHQPPPVLTRIAGLLCKDRSIAGQDPLALPHSSKVTS